MIEHVAINLYYYYYFHYYYYYYFHCGDVHMLASSDPPLLLYRDLFHPSIRVITLVMFVCWPVVTLLYYGISFSVDKISLTDDVFLRHEKDLLYSVH
jgi:hypothetical protein